MESLSCHLKTQNTFIDSIRLPIINMSTYIPMDTLQKNNSFEVCLDDKTSMEQAINFILNNYFRITNNGFVCIWAKDEKVDWVQKATINRGDEIELK